MTLGTDIRCARYPCTGRYSYMPLSHNMRQGSLYGLESINEIYGLWIVIIMKGRGRYALKNIIVVSIVITGNAVTAPPFYSTG